MGVRLPQGAWKSDKILYAPLAQKEENLLKIIYKNAPLAQLAEQLPLKQWVAGSSPARRTKKRPKVDVFLYQKTFVKPLTKVLL